MMNNGLFITFEGGEGTGKTTQIDRLAGFLRSHGKTVVTTREPGGCALSERIRDLVLDPACHGIITAKTELFLYMAARTQHFEQVIKPALDAGNIVLCDRFLDATLAYQGYARGLGVDELYEMNVWALDGRLPDKTFLFLLDTAEGLRRERVHDRFHFESLSFHEKVRDGYIAVAEKFPDRITMIAIDGRNADEVYAMVRKEIEPLL